MPMPNFTAGRRLRASEIDALANQIDSLTAPGWTSYTPTWGGDGTAPVLGNGTLTGRYRRPANADLVHVQINFTAGSTSTYGNSLFYFSLPLTAAAADQLVGVVHLFDAGTIRRPASTIIKTTTLIYVNSDVGTVSNTVPHTWATGDKIDIDLWYQPA